MPPRGQDAGLDHAADAGVLGLGEGLGVAEGAFLEAELLEPGQRPAGVRVVLPFLLGQVRVERLVDERERGAHGHRGAVRFQHAAVAGVDRHAGADAGLRQVHRRDVAALEVTQRRGQLAFERVEEVAAGGEGCIIGSWAADKDD